jgi:hypothetical protein
MISNWTWRKMGGNNGHQSYEGSQGQTYRVIVLSMEKNVAYLPDMCIETLSIDIVGSSACLLNHHFV